MLIIEARKPWRRCELTRLSTTFTADAEDLVITRGTCASDGSRLEAPVPECGHEDAAYCSRSVCLGSGAMEATTSGSAYRLAVYLRVDFDEFKVGCRINPGDYANASAPYRDY
ncbi:hypothetical protein [Clavibacter michiganensis]|uniref:hypothetical protein n=1 Tax=Clavibacter michiganensis TaxID=28447 RepID=UPI0019D3DEB0|nr:hypothetical protein [Clavibacter michiganensis]